MRMSSPRCWATVSQIKKVLYLSNHVLISDRNKLGSDAHNFAIEFVKERKAIVTPTC